ncbi:beta-ketoacyl-ACP synthase II [Endozoicomonas gorgoniicola]|uniref:3-oxoacyl-[acyl-carrier-protein] synthase 2 n=1 Tax=Endozoicomonas gorgoniicola TaxID=1234144 RepID=A0ABT3MVJ8_9GAMM|nr:beta-ketoacyl-ACP synthase II [Endozoicomonas gorgoniicola]MCW7553400.1 beta-ketoacyl-ACP synthase II [Endozoicomonas gorgoniicola]
MSHRRVVVTGLGALCPVGIGVARSWQSVLAGQSGIHATKHLDTENYSVKICGTVKNFQAGDYMNPKDARKMDVFIQYGMVAGIEAIKDAGLDTEGLITEDNAHRYGVAIGSGIGGLTTIENNYDTLQKSGPRRISPFFIPAAIINMAAGWLSMTYNLQGPNFATSTACASGAHSIGLAARAIAYGDADVMVAGGAEKGSSALGMTGFAAARALSNRNDEPELASRPWDKDRDGFVLGDGAAVVVLEEYEHAVRRGATIYAELSGVGMSGDAHHMTSPPEDGRGAARAMQSALDDAGLKPDQVSYINAHGTSTPVGDIAETRAIHKVFGTHAHKLAVSSTKSMTGHLLGAAGSLEAVFAIKSLQEQLAPPTINLVNPDKVCDLDYVPDTFRRIQTEHVLSNSFGFGGTNITLAFSRLD